MTRNEHLKQYLKWGWCIVPVKKGTKMPAVSWKEYQTRKPTMDEMREWFKDPETGVGLVTGAISGVTVIDEDSYKEKGSKLEISSPLVTITGGGGRHLFFKYKQGVANSVHADSAVDIRSEGGFIVLPPTIHPNGTAYRWENENLPEVLNLPEFTPEMTNDWVTAGHTKTDLTEYMNIGEGSRDDSLLRAALSLANKHTEEEVYTLVNAINNTYTPPLPQRDVDRIFRQAVKFVDNHPKTSPESHVAPSEDLSVMSFNQAENRYDELMLKFGNGVTTGFAVLDEYFKFIPTQLYVIAAATHIGKTTFLLNMAARIAECGKKVAIASLEQNVFIVPLLKRMALNQESLNNIKIIAPMSMPTTQDFIKLFEKDDYKPDVLMIDHLHYFKRGNKGATEEIDRLVVELQMLANKLELPVVVVSHLRKLNEKGKGRPTLDDLKDSSSLSQIPGVVCLLHRDKNKDEDIQSQNSYLSRNGCLIIAKNRVQGKTGLINYVLEKTGKMAFEKEVEVSIKNNEKQYIPYTRDASDDILDSDD